MSALSSALRTRVVAVVAAIALALGLVVTAGPQEASAANRDWLRGDATGACEWDPVNYWVQRCDVWSDSMGRNIPVQIQPAARGGNAGLYLLDGLRATDYTNAWLSDVNAAQTYVDSNITLVMPVGGKSSFYADWRAPATYDFNNPVVYKWETFLTEELPGSIIIAGSGAIGVEFAYVLKNFGVDVTIVEFLPRALPNEDAEVSKEIEKQYKKLGVNLKTGHKTTAVRDLGEGKGVEVDIESADGSKSETLKADRVMVSIGFAPRVEGYGLENVGPTEVALYRHQDGAEDDATLTARLSRDAALEARLGGGAAGALRARRPGVSRDAGRAEAVRPSGSPVAQPRPRPRRPPARRARSSASAAGWRGGDGRGPR